MRVVEGVYGMCSARFLDKFTADFSLRDKSAILQVRSSSSNKGFLVFSIQANDSMYTIYKVLPEDRNFQMFMNPMVVLKVRFPEVIGISVESSRSRALVFDFLMVNFFIHTILL